MISCFTHFIRETDDQRKYFTKKLGEYFNTHSEPKS